MIDQLTDAIGEMARAAAIKLAAFAAIGLIVLTGIGFLLAAAYVGLAAKFGAIAAATGIGAGLIALGLVALAVMMQRDPSDAVAKQNGSAKAPARSEDVMLFDMLIHAASAGYATGQGDPKRMQAGLDKLARDLSDLGAFDFPNAAGNDDADRPAPAPSTDTKMAG